MSEPVFREGIFEQGGVKFALASYIRIMDCLAELKSEELQTLLSENGLPYHSEVPRKEAEFALGAALQKAWFCQTHKEVPARIAQCAKSYAARYAEIVKKQGEAMPKKVKKEKVKKEKAPKTKKQFSFEVDSERAKSFRDGRCFEKDDKGDFIDQSLAGHIVRVMAHEKALNADELIEALKAAGYKGTKAAYYRVDALYAAKLLADKRILKRTQNVIEIEKAA